MKRSKGDAHINKPGVENLEEMVELTEKTDNKTVEENLADSVPSVGGSQLLGGLDPGKFVNEEAYCPSSPARTMKVPDLSVILNSPVYHSKVAKSLK